MVYIGIIAPSLRIFERHVSDMLLPKVIRKTKGRIETSAVTFIYLDNPRRTRGMQFDCVEMLDGWFLNDNWRACDMDELNCRIKQ